MAKKIGRPSLFTPATAERICTLIATTNRGLGYILKNNDDLPDVRSVLRWLDSNEEFCRSYLRARELQADLIFDECLEIADETANDAARGDNGKETQHATEQVARSKLRVDTRLRMAGKLAPKKYGDRIEVDQTVREVTAVPSRDAITARRAAWDQRIAERERDGQTVN